MSAASVRCILNEGSDSVPANTSSPITIANQTREIEEDPPSGTLLWMDKLKWSGMANFKAAKKVPVYPDTDHTKQLTGGFYQSYRNLAFYWILNAGHMVRLCEE